MHSCLYTSPIGPVCITAHAGRLVRVSFSEDGAEVDALSERASLEAEAMPCDADLDVLEEARTQLDEYFEGIRRRFDVPIALTGPNRQLEVWSLLLRLPFGMTVTAEQLAKHLGGVDRLEDVRRATSENPLAILVPTHRVLGGVGSVGINICEVRAQLNLLDHERVGAELYAQV